MDQSKAVVDGSAFLGKILSIIGYVFTILCIILIISTNPKGSDLVLLLVFLVFFIFLIVKGSRIKRMIKRFKQYVALISTQQMTSIKDIAASTSQSEDFVKNDLQNMIDKKFFVNASINRATNEIIIGSVASTPQQAQSATEQELETFTCPGCGASGTKLKGLPGNCEYCGSEIKSNDSNDSHADFDKGVAAFDAGDYTKALNELKPFADQDNAKAQFLLGVMYRKGEGVAQNHREAVVWFKKAADQGLADAQFNLGTMYGKGLGVVQDTQQAIAWLKKAAEQGDTNAQNVLKELRATD
ncbi:MAG: sel1 repeat family protein [Desulfuromonadales bacterium]|nr:sel1 repeat family protein [Desulfuromonadales bacterium]